MNDPAVSYCMVPGGGGDDAGLASFEQSHFEDGFNLAQHLAYRRLAEVHLLCGNSKASCRPQEFDEFDVPQTKPSHELVLHWRPCALRTLSDHWGP